MRIQRFGRTTGFGYLVSRDDWGRIIVRIDGWKSSLYPGGVSGWLQLDGADPVEAIRIARWILTGEMPDARAVECMEVENPYPGRVFPTLDRIVRVPPYVPRVKRDS